MLEDTTRIACESLARSMGRRRFLKHAGNAMFAGLAALAAGQLMPALAVAGIGSAEPFDPPVCVPIDGYCNRDGNNKVPSACHGASCYQHLWNGQMLQCRLLYKPYAVGCWTTPVKGGYWVCCDCECGTPKQALCSCAQWSGSPSPRPDVPGAVGA
jgi:hypothetical protein